MCVNVCRMPLCARCMQYPNRPEEGIVFLATGVTKGSVLGTNPGLLESSS